ncbi:MAG: type 1 glutamine amidotransferase [Chloroflexi bacterium]|nr:MAG: type 1 glutamine amidotransferase [Chloroflexota bacterium]
MRALVFQHNADAGLGYFGEPLAQLGVQTDVRQLQAGDAVAAPADYDMLIVLGGDMNVYMEQAHPWLRAVDAALRNAVAADVPVLGVCLGGQLLAKAAGAPVHLNTASEIGLHTVHLTAAGRADPLFAGLPEISAAQWHYDSFALPAGAIHLASSGACANQAFRIGARAYALQFHPEVMPEMWERWLMDLSAPDAARREALQLVVAAAAPQLQQQAAQLLRNFVQLAGAARSRA